jgi:aspartyl/asparaginyl beta-hydroxylase (cupin superfamily)
MPFKRVHEICPQTAAAIGAVPKIEIEGFTPTALYSVLSPHTRIPPHTSSSNIRLIIHLPLIVPEKCGFRVGNETRQWEVGKAWVFDDTIDHEAWNDSDEFRAILMIDIWNPFLSPAERELCAILHRGIRNYYGPEPA